MSDFSNLSYKKYLKDIGINTFLQDQPNNFYKLSNIIKISTNIENIKTLYDLKSFINRSNICALKKYAKKTIYGTGNENAEIMLIGKQPNIMEEINETPFSGDSGILLDKMLNAINIKRDLLYVTNIVPWVTPEDRDPSNEEILQCLPFIQKCIEIINPKIIILLGSSAAKGILNSNLSIDDLRGKWHNYKSINHKKSIECLVTYHPDFLIKKNSYKKHSWKDLQTLQKKILHENI